jgi:hypothetical protein
MFEEFVPGKVFFGWTWSCLRIINESSPQKRRQLDSTTVVVVQEDYVM